MPAPLSFARVVVILSAIFLLAGCFIPEWIATSLDVAGLTETTFGSGLWQNSVRIRTCPILEWRILDLECDSWGDWNVETSDKTAPPDGSPDAIEERWSKLLASRAFMCLSWIIGVVLALYSVGRLMSKTGDKKNQSIGAMVASGICGIIAVAIFADLTGTDSADGTDSWGGGIILALIGSLGMILSAAATYFLK